MATIFALFGTLVLLYCPESLRSIIVSASFWGVTLLFWLKSYETLSNKPRTRNICKVPEMLSLVNLIYIIFGFIYLFASPRTYGLFILLVSILVILQAAKVPFYWAEIEDLSKSP